MEEHIEVSGTIVKYYGQHFYDVELNNGHIVKCYSAGKLRRFKVNLYLNDNVIIKLSQYNLNSGIIFRRL